MRDQFKKKEPIMLSFGIKRKDIIGIVPYHQREALKVLKLL